MPERKLSEELRQWSSQKRMSFHYTKHFFMPKLNRFSSCESSQLWPVRKGPQTRTNKTYENLRISIPKAVSVAQDFVSQTSTCMRHFWPKTFHARVQRIIICGTRQNRPRMLLILEHHLSEKHIVKDFDHFAIAANLGAADACFSS
jgi:hypothetical protein